jgi:hypothetical protein
LACTDFLSRLRCLGVRLVWTNQGSYELSERHRSQKK